MEATIRLCTRLFKKAKTQVTWVRRQASQALKKIYKTTKKRVIRAKTKIQSFFANCKKPQQTKPKPSYQGAEVIPIKSPKKAKDPTPKPAEPQNAKQEVEVQNHEVKVQEDTKKEAEAQSQEIKPLTPQDFQDFYTEWAECFGPALTSMDKKFLEQASPELARKVMYNARLTLRSPYLKAVYNGLKDLENIDDLLQNDLEARVRLRTTFARYYEKGPEYFSKMLDLVYDKGVYPTRSGERRLALDQRLIPEWLGLTA